MAKKNEARHGVDLQCEACKNINYRVSKNTKNTEGRLEIKKYCNTCKKTTNHKEKK